MSEEKIIIADIPLPKPGPTLQDHIRDVVERLDDQEFHSGHIDYILTEMGCAPNSENAKNVIAAALNKLHKSGYLVRVTEAYGPCPHTYARSKKGRKS